MDFPGAWALVPVVGVQLIILAGSKAYINKKFLSNKLIVWFGLISFPLYLWHWPLLSFARILEGEFPSRNIRIIAVLLSIMMAWLTYQFVEYPIRFNKKIRAKNILLLLTMILIGSAGYTIYKLDGLPFRALNKKFVSYTLSIKTPDREKECFEIPHAYKRADKWFCSLGDMQAPAKYFAYGDSHALSLLPALEKYAIQNKLRIEFTGTSGCPSLLGIQSMRGHVSVEMYNCRELNERIFNYIKSTSIKEVILASRWTYYTDSLSRPSEFNPIARDIDSPIDKASSTKDLVWAMKNTVSRYNKIGVKVIFIEDNPQQKFESMDILRKGRGIEEEYLKLSVGLEEHKNNQKFVNMALQNTGAKTINLDDILCPMEICPLVANSKFLYSSDDHLSVEGALMVFPALSDRLKHR